MKFYVYKDIDNQWRWQLRARNGKIIANCGEGYVKQSHAEKMCWKIIENAGTASVAFSNETKGKV